MLKEPIGGYFSLELPLHEEYHKEAIKLNTGRNCLEYILRIRKYSKVYIPYYSCDVLLEPFRKLGIEYTFYHINLDFDLAEEIILKKDEAILYINYFGLKQNYVKLLAERYGTQLLVDNTQAFYSKPIDGVDTFYSCRKFFGVPDGAYLYIDHPIDEKLEQDISWERMNFLAKRIDLSPEEGYSDFRQQSHNLIGQPIKLMSKLTERLMQSIDYNAVADKRRKNYNYLQEHLAKSNQLHLAPDEDAVPMIYPFLTDKMDLRDFLIRNKIFVAKYWPNVLDRCKGELEYILVNKLVALPVDQRHQKNEMLYILNMIDSWK